jgi:hypothetical protein
LLKCAKSGGTRAGSLDATISAQAMENTVPSICAFSFPFYQTP